MPLLGGGVVCKSDSVTKPYEFIGFGAMEVTKPYEFIGFGTMDATKPYEFIGFGACASGPLRHSVEERMFRTQRPPWDSDAPPLPSL